MTGSSGAVRKTSLAFDLLKKSLTYPRLLRQCIQKVSLLFLRSPELKPGVLATETPARSSGRGAVRITPQHQTTHNSGTRGET